MHRPFLYELTKVNKLIAFIFISLFILPHSHAIDLPDKFEDVSILQHLRDPASMAFAPDGRLFFGERITGKLRVAYLNPTTNTWEVQPEAFFTFDVPNDRHRSAGLRGFAFDPEFKKNGYIYAFYMKNNPRHNRVVRIQADPNNPHRALSDSETLLIELPFNSSTSSGSHNGGDITFGADGRLYFTTGDGWNGGDHVQSLTTFTGKLFRINKDGSIPQDNPFYTQTQGAYRAIYCLGLRNPYTIAMHPHSGSMYINDAVGSKKATVYQVSADGSDAGKNFGHDGYNGIGTSAGSWTNVSVDGKILVTGGAWYPNEGYWPEAYKGNYFAALWGSNSGDPGAIVRVQAESDLGKSMFASNVILPSRHKPVMTKIGPDGNLYYMLTDYETGDAAIHMIRYTGVPTVSAPQINPPGGKYEDPVQIQMTTTTSDAQIYYTTDGTTPTRSATLYEGPFTIGESLTLRAIAYADNLQPSNETTAGYTIGPILNIPPVADAGPDLTAIVNTIVTLNGSNSYDPDGSPLEISETWEQIGGPPVYILDADETVANFTASETGDYTFRIVVTDVDGAQAMDTVWVSVRENIPDILDQLIARWSMDEGKGELAEDLSGNAHRGVIRGASWSEETPVQSAHALLFDGNDDRVDIGNLDLTSNSMTISFWFNADDFDVSDARFISKAEGQYDQDHYWMVSALNSSKLRFRLKTNGMTKTLISPSGILSTGIWTHIAAVYDGNQMILYRNGEIVASTPASGNIDSNPDVSAAIGDQPSGITGGSRSFDGLIDEMRIYGRALSDEELDIVRTASPNVPPDTIPENIRPMISWESPISRTIHPEGTAIPLQLSGFDEDGSITHIDLYLDGEKIAQIVDTPYIYNWTEPLDGIRTWHAIAYDDRGATDTTEYLVLGIYKPEEGAKYFYDGYQPIVLYTFEEGVGSMVKDVSGWGTPLDLVIADTTTVSWVPGGLALNTSSLLTSAEAPGKVFQSITSSQELTLEAWVRPDNLSQRGPARILSFSQDLYYRNFTLGQDRDEYVTRLRTTETDSNGRPDLNGNSNTTKLELTHVVFTRNSEGEAILYVDGQQIQSFSRDGTFENWDSSFGLIVGNEWTRNRPWLGTLYEIAIYDLALEEDIIQQHYQWGNHASFEQASNMFRTSNPSPETTIRIRPNPTTNQLFIQSDQEAAWAIIRLMNVQGQRVLERNVSSLMLEEIDVSGLSEGIYFLEVQTPEQKHTQKIVIER